MIGRLLQKEDICERYGIKISTLYEWTSTNYIPHLKVGGKLLFREQDIMKWEDSRFVGLPNTKLL